MDVVRKHPDAKCEECPLYGKPIARTLHPKKLPAKAAIVSRSPGPYEARTGEPFTGESGKVLNHLLNANGVTRDEVLLTNVVLCAPDAGKVPPEAIKACAPRLDAELTGYEFVVACGREAVNLIIGSGAIDRYRGYRIQQNGRWVVAANNPALVLHDDSTFPNLKRDFNRAFNPPPDPIIPTVHVIEDIDIAKRYIKSQIKEVYPVTAADIESRGGLTHKASLISIQFSNHPTSAVVLGERQGLFDDRDFIECYLRPYLESKHHTFVWHNGKFDTKILRHTYGINARVDHDTMLLSYALDERSGTDERVGVHGLDYLLMDTFGWPYYSSPSVESAKKTGEVSDYDEFYRYAGLDVGGTLQLFQTLYANAERDNVLEPYTKVLLPANKFLTDVELNGMVYDVPTAADLHEFVVQPELDELIADMRKSVDNPLLKPSSPAQMAHLLYDTWGIRHDLQRRPDMARSVDDAARAEIIEGRFRFRGDYRNERTGNLIRQVKSSDHSERENFYRIFVGKYDRFQKLAKQANTYLVGMIKRAETDEDSRIYTQLNLHGTNSGRLSSSKPNLQNITRTKEGLPDIRRLFRASEGRAIVQADFSQAELRCIAQFSGDTELTRIYANDLSLHKETATRFYGPEYTPEQYSTCKNVNFGVFYQQGAETFQEKHGIPKDQAQAYIDWVWKTFTGVKEWEDEVEREVRTRRILTSPFGRKRRFHLLTRENQQAAIREGINFYPQSTAHDLTLCSGIALHDEIDRSRCSIGILVHDSIVADVDEGYIDEYSTLCLQIMAGIAKDKLDWDIPFKAEIGVGPDWGSCK
jgi:uracil-DNA glycosylase family 4